MTETQERSRSARDYSGLIILAVLCGLEVGILYVLIAFDTPLRPIVDRLLKNPAGVFTLVMSVVFLLILGMWGFTSWAERAYKKSKESERAV